MIPNVLTIAGTDPSGGAGVQADLKTFSALGAFATCVTTAVVAQNTQGVAAVHQVPPEMVEQQLDTLLADVRIDAVKVGMLGTEELVRTVAAGLRRMPDVPVVVDPVMVTTSGHRLLERDAVEALREDLLPEAGLVTPNIPEAADLLGEPEAGDEQQMRAQLERLAGLCPRVLLKGGHLGGAESVDLLLADGAVTTLTAPRVQTTSTHGTGCTLSAAIAALRPQRGTWVEAVSEAKEYVTCALEAADRLDVGKGSGPQHHFHAWW